MERRTNFLFKIKNASRHFTCFLADQRSESCYDARRADSNKVESYDSLVSDIDHVDSKAIFLINYSVEKRVKRNIALVITL